MPALMVLLGVGKQAHENQSRYHTSGYDVLHHGCHSPGGKRTIAIGARTAKMMTARAAAVNAPQAPTEPCGDLFRVRVRRARAY